MSLTFFTIDFDFIYVTFEGEKENIVEFERSTKVTHVSYYLVNDMFWIGHLFQLGLISFGYPVFG